MATARETHTENVLLGAGEIFIDVYENDAPTGAERYLGDSAGMTLSLTTERTTIQSGDGAVARDLVDVVRSVSRTLGFTLRDSSVANWNLFILGEEAQQEVSASEATTVIAGIKPGMWYQLGQSAQNPSGPGAINAVVMGKVKAAASGGNRQAMSDTDEFAKLEFDLSTARVRLKEALSANRVDVEIAYTPSAARSIAQAKASAAASQITCAIRYVEVDGLAGGALGRNVYARKCNLIPGGESALKSRDTEQQLAFTATILDPGSDDGYPPLVIDGVEK